MSMEPEIVIEHDVCSDEDSNNVLMHTQVKLVCIYIC